MICKKSRQIILCGLFSACFTAPAILWAGIANQGNEAVIIEIRKEDGFSQRANLYPEQSIQLPADAREVELLPRSFGGRGDEEMQVRVVERSGKTTYLTKFGESVEIGTGEDFLEQQGPLKPGRAMNEGNISVDLRITSSSGLSDMRTLYLGDTLRLPKQTEKVQVLANRNLRGDEEVRVVVYLPDGSRRTISGLGGIAEIEKEEEFLGF